MMQVFIGKSFREQDQSQVLDRNPHKQLGLNAVKHIKYVENFLHMGHNPATVGGCSTRTTIECNRRRLCVHEIVETCNHKQFCGMEFDGLKHTIGVSSKRIRRFRVTLNAYLKWHYETPHPSVDLLMCTLLNVCSSITYFQKGHVGPFDV